MKALKNPKIMGKKILESLKKHRLLLLQDRTFPNIVAEVVGAPIKGSWWGHELANPIYNGLLWIEDNSPVIIAKLISGKVTYIDDSLRNEFNSIVCKRRTWQIKNLNDNEMKLMKSIESRKSVLSNDVKLKKEFPQLKKIFEKLEKRILVYSCEEHTQSGKHIKVYKSWSKSDLFEPPSIKYEDAIDVFNAIVDRHNLSSNSKARLPW